MLQGKNQVPSTDLMTIQPVLVNKYTYAPSMINSWRPYTVLQTLNFENSHFLKMQKNFPPWLIMGQQG